MPTGYTAPVADGKITELADFVLTCARGFGALVMLRDSDQSLEATRRFIAQRSYIDDHDYYQRALERETAELEALQAMSDEEALAAAQKAADEARETNERWARDRAETRERYEAMIEKAEAWEAPATHHEFKEFILRQLRDSIENDCRELKLDVPEVSLEWREKHIERLKWSINRDRDEIADQQDRNEKRSAWVEALMESLGEAVPA